MTLGNTSGGLPYVLRETITTTGRKVDLKVGPQWICLRVSGFPCKVFFTQEDFDSDTNYLSVVTPSVLTPYGEWQSLIDTNYLWLKGDGGSSDIELVCCSSAPEYPSDYGIGPVFGGSGGAPVATITTTQTGVFNFKAYGFVGEIININWGDGSAQDVVLTGSYATTAHSYVLGGLKTITVTNPMAITGLDLIGMNLSGSIYGILIHALNLIDLRLGSNPALNGWTDVPDSTWDRLSANNWTFLHLVASTGITGEVGKLKDFDYGFGAYLSNTRLEYNERVTWSKPFDGSYIRVANLLWPSAMVGNFLVDIEQSGINNTDLYIDGNNQAPPATQDVIDAMAAMTARGVVLHVT